MSAAKKRNAKHTDSGGFHAISSWLLGPGRAVLIAAIAFAAIAGGLILAWISLEDRILGSPELRLDPQLVEITPLPDWIHADLRTEVFGDPALDGPLSIVDGDLAERIARAFERHPWVAKVVRVQPVHPASVQVELEYRRPVCMIDVSGRLLPVDVEAYLLPEGDFSPGEKARYPRLTGVEQMPLVPAGTRWPHAKIIGGAEIAAAIGPAWEAMRLQRIVPLDSDPAAPRADGDAARRNPSRRSVEPFFMLVTRGGTQILWGYAPGAGAIGELPAAEKVARLKQYLSDNDSLDGPEGWRKDLDVRTMPPSVAR